MSRIAVRWLAAAGVVLGGCSPSAFGCEDDGQCSAADGAGSCELNGYCSFPDDDCRSGRRYGDAAGGGLAGLCVNTAEDTETGSQATGTGTTIEPTTQASSSSEPTAEASSMTASSEPATQTTAQVSVSSTETTTTSSTTSETGSDSSSGGVSDDDLLFWFAFEEDPQMAGGVFGENGSRFSATCAPTECPTLVAGPRGMAASFDGIDDRLDIDDHPQLRFNGPFSIAFWARLERVPTEDYSLIVGKAFGDGSFNSYEFYYSQSEDFTTFSTDSAGYAGVQLGGSFPNGWVHLAGTWDGAALRFYVDGMFVGQDVLDSPPAYDTHAFRIGGDNDEGMARYFWPGAIDELRVYGRQLDAMEITALAIAD